MTCFITINHQKYAICIPSQEYDELVLATGSSPFVPPVAGLNTSIPGIFLYRTIEDMDAWLSTSFEPREIARWMGENRDHTWFDMIVPTGFLGMIMINGDTY